MGVIYFQHMIVQQLLIDILGHIGHPSLVTPQSDPPLLGHHQVLLRGVFVFACICKYQHLQYLVSLEVLLLWSRQFLHTPDSEVEVKVHIGLRAAREVPGEVIFKTRQVLTRYSLNVHTSYIPRIKIQNKGEIICQLRFCLSSPCVARAPPGRLSKTRAFYILRRYQTNAFQGPKYRRQDFLR